jgi:hypothetical protein
MFFLMRSFLEACVDTSSAKQNTKLVGRVLVDLVGARSTVWVVRDDGPCQVLCLILLFVFSKVCQNKVLLLRRPGAKKEQGPSQGVSIIAASMLPAKKKERARSASIRTSSRNPY